MKRAPNDQIVYNAAQRTMTNDHDMMMILYYNEGEDDCQQQGHAHARAVS